METDAERKKSIAGLAELTLNYYDSAATTSFESWSIAAKIIEDSVGFLVKLVTQIAVNREVIDQSKAVILCGGSLWLSIGFRNLFKKQVLDQLGTSQVIIIENGAISAVKVMMEEE
jgi:hypothetical protein